MTDWGAHHFGGATFICDVRELQPVEVTYHENSGTPYLSYRYPNGLIIYHNRPNTENLAIEIWRRLEPCLRGETVKLSNIRLYETADLYVDYGGK